MKRYLSFPVLALAALVIPILSTSSWASERSAPHRFQQQHGIAQGVRNGSITGPEFRHLQRQQRRLHVARHRAWADGRLNAREHQRLSNMRRRAHRHIYRARHNRARYHAYRSAPMRVPCRVQRPAPRMRRSSGFLHGAVMQPGWSVGWNIPLD